MSRTIWIVSAAVAIFSAFAQTGRALGPVADEGITMVLVHGDFAESSSWGQVIRKLAARGYRVVAVANPLRRLKAESDSVGIVLETIKGPVVLVGHSYGGSVIANAARGRENVTALVYVDGTAPGAGATTAGLSAKFPGGTLGLALAPPVQLPEGGKDVYIRHDKYRAQFAADVPEGQAAVMAATQRPVTEAALNETPGVPPWKTIPSWFIYGQLDNNIPPAAHVFMAKRAGAREIVEVKTGSHVVMISHPDVVAQLIERAAESTSKQTLAAHALDSLEPPVAWSQPTADAFAPAPVVPLASQPPARLVVDAPLPAQLATGYVVVRYRGVKRTDYLGVRASSGGRFTAHWTHARHCRRSALALARCNC